MAHPSRRGSVVKTELAKLPRHARSVIAIRAVSRIQSLVAGESAELFRSVDHLVQLGAKTAAEAAQDHGVIAETAARLDALFSLTAAEQPVHSVLQAAKLMAMASTLNDDSAAVDTTSSTLLASATAAGEATGDRRTDAMQASDAAAWRDYDLLRLLAEREEWTDDTPVDVAILGPLWPWGEPEGWPEEAKEERGNDEVLEIEFEFPEGASEAEVLAAARDVWERVNALHRSVGGKGVVLDGTDLYREAGVPQGVTA